MGGGLQIGTEKGNVSDVIGGGGVSEGKRKEKAFVNTWHFEVHVSEVSLFSVLLKMIVYFSVQIAT